MNMKKASSRLKELRIVGGFLDGFKYSFTDKLNCIIGARGTGKTTVLEFIRYGLNAMPLNPKAHKRIAALVEGNLRGGRLELTIAKRDARYEELLKGDFKLLVNPTGNFVIGGPHGDTGLTGRKIIVDTYGGRGAHGGGAFSGKDPSKVDRSAAYAARWIAKNMVAAGVAKEMLVQISYAIGVAKPVSVCVNTYGTTKVAMSDGEIAQVVNEMFDLRPQGIIEALKLKQPMYEETARYGHMGRTNEVVKKVFVDNGQTIEREVELFTWEKLDRVEEIRAKFGL